jgi:hypothetical protein
MVRAMTHTNWTKQLRIAGVLGVVVAVGAHSTPARADGFAEGVIGMALPLGDDTYDNGADTSLKLGVRGGALGQSGFGFELAADWTPINDNYGGTVLGQTIDVSFNRFRLQGGLRYAAHPAKARSVTVFARALVGVDILHWSVDTTILGATSSSSDTDTGLALEPGFGVVVNVGSVAIGGQFAVPIGFHSDSNANDNVDTSYRSYDLDLLFTLAAAM